MIDPHVSDPMANGTSPAATAAPDPEDDPPAQRPVFQGFRGTGEGGVRLPIPQTARDFHHRQLRHQDRPGVVQFGNDGRIPPGNAVFVRGGSPGCGNARRVQQILGSVGNAMQRPAVFAGGEFLVGPAGLLAGEVGRQCDHGIELGADLFQAIQNEFRQLDRGEFPRPPR